ncbi:MAG: IPTL-CTERM sorting domain-containing protein [candidate division Zixibacteria bacterium]
MGKKLIAVVFLLSSLLWSSMALAYIQEDNTHYQDKLFDKEFQLTPSSSEVVVKFNDTADFDRFINEFNFQEAQILDRKKRIGVYKVPPGITLAETIDLLTANPWVEKAVPAYIDQEGYTKYCVPTEVTVRFNSEVKESRMLEIINEVGSNIVRRQWTPGYFTIHAPMDKGYFEIIRELISYDEVKFSEPSIISYNDEAWTPNDTYFNSQWALRNTGHVYTCQSCSPLLDHDIDAQTGWDYGRGDPGVVISIIDTGMDLTHPDLAANLLPRNGHDWDFADTDNSPDDEGNHGTACSGIAAAVANNNIGVAGIANQCRIMPLRINLTSGYNQNRADAINYATSRRPDFDGLILSNSWIMSSGDYSAVHDAIVNAYANDVLVCFAAGNYNSSVEYPALYPEAMAIAASSPCDERKSPTSCDGESWGSCYGSELDCAAPGVLIYTTDRQGSNGYSSGDYYNSFNGTSSACPQVAGVAGVVWAQNPSLTNVQVRNLINNTADQVGGYYYDPGTGKSNELGHGRVSLSAAAGYSGCFQDSITVVIMTDDYPTETSWEIVQQGFGVVGTGEGYYAGNNLFVESICVNPNACYDFTIFDEFNDGICCSYGNGYYEVYYNNQLVGSGGEFGSFETVADIGPGCDASIPTLSEWGMILLSLMLLALGSAAAIRRRRCVAVEGKRKKAILADDQ